MRIARIIVREGVADLILGVCVKDQKFLAPGKVYEIGEVLGELTIKEIGKTHVNWNRSACDLLDEGKHIFLSEEEYKQLELKDE